MASSEQESSGTTLMDLITSDPAPAASSAPSAPTPSLAASGTSSTLGKPATERKSKRATLMQIQNETISAAKALNPVKALPQRQKKKKKKSSQRQLVNHVFPKLAVYNSVDPSVAPSLLMLHQQCEDRNVLQYVYYYLARILSDTGAQGLSPGGGIPTPNWDALADIDAVGGVTRADVIPRIVDKFSSESLNVDIEYISS